MYKLIPRIANISQTRIRNILTLNIPPTDSNNVVTINFMFKLCVMNLNGLNVRSSLRIFIALKSISKILGWVGCNPSGPNHAGATLLVAFQIMLAQPEGLRML